MLPGDAGKTGGFARAVGPDEGHTFPWVHLKTHALDCFDAIKVFDQLLHLQGHGCAWAFGFAVVFTLAFAFTLAPNNPSSPEGAATMIAITNRPKAPRQ